MENPCRPIRMGAYLSWGACALDEVFPLDWGEARPPISTTGGQERDRFAGRATPGAAFADIPARAGVRQAGRRALLREHRNHQRKRLRRTGTDFRRCRSFPKIDSYQPADGPGPHLSRGAPDSQRKRPDARGFGISEIHSRILAFLPCGKRLAPAARLEIPAQAPLVAGTDVSKTEPSKP
jgi:hypothetical protein